MQHEVLSQQRYSYVNIIILLIGDGNKKKSFVSSHTCFIREVEIFNVYECVYVYSYTYAYEFLYSLPVTFVIPYQFDLIFNS